MENWSTIADCIYTFYNDRWWDDEEFKFFFPVISMIKLDGISNPLFTNCMIKMSLSC